MDPLSLISPEAIEEMYQLHPMQFIIWSALAFSFGFLVGRWCARARDLARAEAKYHEDLERERSEVEKALAECEESRRKEVEACQKELEKAQGEARKALAECEESYRRKLEAELARQRDDEEKRIAELREHVIRAHNLIAQLNQQEAKTLRSLIDGNNQLYITAPGTTGLLSLGAIKFLADAGSYVSGRGELGYFSVSPTWRTYASWERDLLDQRADGK